MKYCRYCGLPTFGDPEMEDRMCSGHLGKLGLCQGGSDQIEFCPRCGDWLSEDATHCSCDKQD